MKQIIFDCDNTFGVKDCDVDDGLALLYLLGCGEAKVHGITTTYGNNEVEVVYHTTKKMLKDLGRMEIPVKKGGAKKGAYKSEAVDYLVDMANRYAGELSILATGSLTNLCGAYKKDSHFFEKVKEIVLMGGITSPLVFEKKVMNELNFSCDAHATWTVLTKGRNVSIITGNNCLKVLFTKEEYKERLFQTENKSAKYIREKTDYWFKYNEDDYGIKGFYNWDVIAGVYLIRPELFFSEKKTIFVSERNLEVGLLKSDKAGNCRCRLPVIQEEQALKNEIYRAWLQVKIP
ncbi:MAG: nucleoside hydrolase [Lachnospiraceae bacterium]|nr:nucleoside hydrolase [Lachnospiraceae bacterium]